jgi:hypothetical protein
MKKSIVLFFVLTFLPLVASEGQITKGKMQVGVSSSFNFVSFGTGIMDVGFTSIKQKSNAAGYVEPDGEKITTFNLLPKVGYFFVDNFVAGLDVCLSSSTDKSASDSKSTMTYFGVGPYFRYYFPGNKIMPFIEFSTLFGSINDKYTSDSFSDSYKTSLMSIGGGAGMAVKLGEKVTFDIMAGYNSLTEKEKEDNVNDERTVYGTFGFKLGFVYILGGK